MRSYPIRRKGEMRQKRREQSGMEFAGDIMNVRAIEDSIRMTKKYTEGLGTMRKHHPIQGDDIPSKVFCKFYEVYPTMDVTWDMSIGKGIDMILGDLPIIRVTFRYDYRTGEASFTVNDGPDAMNDLCSAIPGFAVALAVIKSEQKAAV